MNSSTLNKYPYPVNVALQVSNMYSYISDAEMSDITETLDKFDIMEHHAGDIAEIEKLINIMIPGHEYLSRHLDIFNMRFVQKLTYQEIGDKIGKSRERVRAIVEKMLRIMRCISTIGFVFPLLCTRNNDKCFKYQIFLKHGELKHFDELRIVLGCGPHITSLSLLREYISQVNNNPILLKIGKDGIVKYIGDLEKELKETKEELSIRRKALGIKGPDTIPNIPIEELGFTVRTYNCLKKAGINNLRDCVKWTKERMKNIRNLGQRSLSDVINKLKEYDIELQEE